MLRAADVMTTEVFSVAPDTPIRDVARLMSTKHISGVPVIDRERRIVGIVSEGDLIRHAALVGEQRPSWWSTAFTSASALAHDYVKTHGRTAAEVMTAPVITVALTDSVAQCANILDQYRLKRVLVVENGSLVGIVTRSDLLKALATADAIQPETVDDSVIRKQLFVSLRLGAGRIC